MDINLNVTGQVTGLGPVRAPALRNVVGYRVLYIRYINRVPFCALGCPDKVYFFIFILYSQNQRPSTHPE